MTLSRYTPITRRSPMRRKAGKRRRNPKHMAKVKVMQCIACVIEECDQPSQTEVHHCNEGGHAGQKRRGDDFVLPLCAWHHRGQAPAGMTVSEALYHLGPPLTHSKRFRESYGTDDELLAMVTGNMPAPSAKSLNQEESCQLR
jgi:hypothetical protein